MAHPSLSPSLLRRPQTPLKTPSPPSRPNHAKERPRRPQPAPPALFPPPAHYEHFSALRSTHEPEPPLMFHPGYSAVDECGCDPEAAPARLTPCEECAQECAQECDSASCAVELTSQCTDQCVVVACNDAHHGGTSCEEILPGPACGKECFGEVDCAAFDELFRCCNEYHPEQPDYRPYSSDLNMAAAYAFISDPAFDSYFAGSSQTQTLPARDPVAFPPLDSSTSTPQLVPSPAFQPSPSPFGQREPSVSVPSPHLPELPSPVAQTQQAPLLQCKWAGCIATFSTLSDLVGHVNLQHLRLPSPLGAFPAPSPYMTPPGSDTSQQQGASQQQSPTENSVACLWGDCQLYPPSQSVPGPSSGSNYDVIDFLASHLLEDHLGLPARAAHHTPTPTPAPFGQGLFQAGPSPLGQAPPSRSPPPPTPVVSLPEGGPPTPVPEHDCSAPSAHVCKWTGCGKSFTSCDTLTEHIASAHIGSGRAHYDCYWEGCGRNGESGFASKQKISRHMQSHTGHRPFQCTVCNQNFSEAATLAQHMRRHTQEKPYACDFPGCGKAFAIAGALTIHKRIHNGSKPFKCSFCDRAFSESSNLSKHLRTHTGARPYPCTEPGCSKSFARPDQLARHMGVHKRKAAENAAKVAAAS